MAHGRRPRQGSLAWYHNSKSGINVPSIPKKNPLYFLKIRSSSVILDGKFMAATLLKQIPYTQEGDKKLLKLSTLGIRKNDRFRESTSSSEEIKDAEEVVLTGFTKSKGIIGAVARRGLKLQKRKGIGAGVRRHPGNMGCRHPPGTSWRKPFMGRMGGSQRTIRGNKLLSWSLNSEGQCEILIKGSVPGNNGSVVAVRKNE